MNYRVNIILYIHLIYISCILYIYTQDWMLWYVLFKMGKIKYLLVDMNESATIVKMSESEGTCVYS